MITATVVALLFLPSASKAQNALSSLTRESLEKFSPRAEPRLVQAILDAKDELLRSGITSSNRLSYLMAQFATETGGLRRIDENLWYGAGRLQEIFPNIVRTREKANELAGKPRAIANYVYGHRLGNCGRHTDDGYNFRGSGYIQLTGRYNFRERGKAIKLDLEGNPDLARRPKEGLSAALAYWKARNVNAAADANDPHRVRVLVNGKAAVAYAESLIWLRKAKAAFGPQNETDSDSTNQDLKSLVGLLTDAGLLKSNLNNREVDEETASRALQVYQRKAGLIVSGKLDDDTLYSITDNPIERERSLGEQILEADQGSCLEAGITADIYDANTDEIENSEAMISQEAGSATEANEGTGVTKFAAVLNQRELEFLASARALYPFYESGTSVGQTNTDFIPYSVIEPDDREIVQPTTEYPSRTVVQISFIKPSNGVRYNCSGTMIAKNVVLTAGHCVHDGGEGGWFQEYTVYPARNGVLKPYGECKAKSLFALEGWTNAQFDGDRRPYDIGAIKLDCEVGDVTGWLRLSQINDEALELATAIYGYPCDKAPAGRMFLSRDKIRAISKSNIFYKNDTFGCMSGSGILDDENGLIGVHTSGRHGEEPWMSNNSGTRITKNIEQQLHIWIAQ